MPRFFSRTGDDGFTSLLGKKRVPKYHPIIETLGTLDEANAALGLARSACKMQNNSAILLMIQRDLHYVMAEIAATPENASRFRRIDRERVNWLEAQLEALGSQVDMPGGFIVPGDSLAGAALSLARTIVRRAERRVAQLVHEHVLENLELLHYLNRLSSLCFALALCEDKAAGIENPSLVG